jgi:hypothetical protein
MLGRVIQQVDGLAHLGGKLHQAVQKLRALPTTFWTVIHCARPPGHGRLLGLLHRRPPGVEGINDALAGLARAPKGDAQPRPGFIPNPTGNILLVPAQVMIPRPMLTTREAAPGDVPKRPGGVTSATQAFEAGRGRGLLVFFSICANMASVSALFFCGWALRTLRHRKPIRLSPSAMGLGAGHGSAL